MLTLATLVTVFQGGVTSPVQAAPTNDLYVDVVDVDTAAAVTDFKYIINVDNTGSTELHTPTGVCDPESPGYPEDCPWTSMRTESSAPIYTQGTQDDFPILDMPDGRYLISVLADGYKLDGEHFTLPMDDGAPLTVLLQSNADGLPDITIQAAIFEDISPTNGAPDLPAEHGLAGFKGGLLEILGDMQADVYGNPLCTIYVDNDTENGAVAGSGGNCFSYCYVVDGGVDIGVVLPIGGTPANNVGRCPTIPTDLESGDPTGLQMWPLPDYYSHPTASSVYNVNVPATAAIEGKLIYPHLGSGRYAMFATAPDGQTWTQTTTLEGNHDYDVWTMEGSTGLDTEFVIAGEPFPATIFGFVPPDTNAIDPAASGSISGTVVAIKQYIPMAGGLGFGEDEFGANGSRIDKPIDRPWLALNDLGNGDTAVWVGRGDADGSFTIPNVPDGTYTLTWWDEPQDYILSWRSVTVVNGEAVDMGILQMTGWWTQYDGFVFNDSNRNGIMDWTDTDADNCPDPGEGELGVPNYGLTLRRRENTLMDRGTTTVGTDACGHYYFESGYPMQQWLVMEAYHDLYYTTGITYQTDNQPTPTTVLGAGVDVSTLPVIGLSGRMDWGVHAYDATGTNGVDPSNGGIVGTVSYDTTRNELDPRYAAVEDWQPGVSNLPVELYTPVACPLDVNLIPTAPCDPTQRYQLDSDGSYSRGQLINTYLTETWAQPGENNNANGDGECIPRDVDGNELTYPDKQQITSSHSDCLESPLMGVQFQKGFSAVDGNYGFGDGCFAPNHLDATDVSAPVCLDPADNEVEFTALPGGTDYLVHVGIPDDAQGRPQYNFTREEDINIAHGDPWVPQALPPACAGSLHTVDVADGTADSYPETYFGIDPDTGQLVQQPSPVGAVVTVPASEPTDNPTFIDIGASPYEGQQTPICDTKLVPLANGRSIVPTFNVYTDVPLPGRFWGLLVDDLNFSSNKHQINYGEKAGIPFSPVGIYDYTNRLVFTTESDYSGLFDVLLPSTDRISCPTPSGVCANVYRFVGNDPGVPGALNPNWNPQYRTIAAEFEAFPGVIVPADLAPTQIGVSIQLPGGQAVQVQCPQEADVPQLFAVDKPYVVGPGSFTINGLGFGSTQGSGAVLLDSTAIGVTSWNDTTIVASVPGSVPFGPHQLSIRSDNGRSTVSGLTFHVMDALAPVPFTATPVLSDFNTGGNANSLGSGWAQDVGTGVFSSDVGNNNQARVRTTGSTARDAWRTAGSPFGASQDAYFTFTNRSPIATEQGLLLKYSGGANPNSTSAQWIEVAVTNSTGTVVVRTKSGTATITTHLTLPAAFTGLGRLGARAMSDGTVRVYQGTTLLGQVSLPATAAWTGRIGVRFTNTGTGSPAANETRFDNFGGGNVAFATPVYHPNVYEVGPGKTYQPANTLPAAADHAIQDAINAAAASAGNDLVVVYPGLATPSNSRLNPRGAYYENLIISSPVKLQGVGPGGFQGSNWVAGSIIDGAAFGGDSPVAGDWRTAIEGLTWDGNQTIYDGAIVSIYAQQNGGQAFGSAYKASIDGFDLRGGDQQGFRTNLQGESPALPPTIETQGGAVFANAYARNLQITNNTVQNNGGAYGTIRIGTPAIGDNNNENVRIAYNRIIANGGTNLAGAIGLFTGSDNYEVAANDICGNFSAEYGGGISAYGLSPNGNIHDNRIWFNRTYDEGAGIMIAGQLPSDPASLSPGSGPVNIYNNLIQANLANDDGAGLRFLMAGNFPINVYNNIIVNNVSTHEGGGVALDDATNVRFYNNTVMKNLTTATAITSNGLEAPAGLSTGANSAQLQATLPSGSPTFSNPVLFNNIFWDNRAGKKGSTTVTGLGLPGTGPIVNWDMGSLDGSGPLTPTNSVLQTLTNTTPSGTNSSVNPAIAGAYDTVVSFEAWRTNPAFIGAILVSVDVAPYLLGDYHIASGSSAVDKGASAKSGVNAPNTDYDHQARPGGCQFDAGADEIAGAICTPVNLGILKTDGQTAVNSGSTVSYTITVTKAGTGVITGAPVVDNVPAGLSSPTWTCTASGAGSSCAAPSGSGNINTTVTLGNAASSSATFVLTGTVTGTGSIANTATVDAPAGSYDTNASNNTSTDTDTIITLPALPALTVLDTFNRPNVGNLNTGAPAGVAWSQTLNSQQVNANQALCNSSFLCGLLGSSLWNGTGTPFGNRQLAAFTFANSTISGSGLLLKASGGGLNFNNHLRVRVNGGNVEVASTTSSGISYANYASFPATFASGDTLIAMALEDGTVAVYKNSALVGAVVIPLGTWAPGSGGGRIGMQLPNGARVDNFVGRNVP